MFLNYLDNIAWVRVGVGIQLMRHLILIAHGLKPPRFQLKLNIGHGMKNVMMIISVKHIGLLLMNLILKEFIIILLYLMEVLKLSMV